MQTYVVRRPGIAAGASELDAAFTRLRAFEEEPPERPARWLRSYALREADGRLGLACVFQADSARALQQHAELTQLAAAEILPVAATLRVRPFAPAMVYLVRRRSVWKTATEMARGAAAARRVGSDEMAREVSWLHSYAVNEGDGTLGSVCLYQGIDPQALRTHAARVGMAADAIVPVIGRIVFRADPPQPSAPAHVTPA
ncbi:MAG TPA: nickel-binding protein [Burkholderiaceae bacterium]|nr:nickel-binding protein [Burkholderiaceae bacterium]